MFVQGDDTWDVAWSDSPSVVFNSVFRMEPFQCMNHFPCLGLILVRETRNYIVYCDGFFGACQN